MKTKKKKITINHNHKNLPLIAKSLIVDASNVMLIISPAGEEEGSGPSSVKIPWHPYDVCGKPNWFQVATAICYLCV